MLRASVAVERAGFASASIVTEGFIKQGEAIRAALMADELPIAEYPGVIMTDSADVLREKVRTRLVPQLIEAFVAGKAASPQE